MKSPRSGTADEAMARFRSASTEPNENGTERPSSLPTAGRRRPGRAPRRASVDRGSRHTAERLL